VPGEAREPVDLVDYNNVHLPKKTPILIDSKPTSENREGRRMTYAIKWADWEETRGHIHQTSCSVVISPRRE
jgi:hypothetical protein